MKEYYLKETLEQLEGASYAHITDKLQCAVVALNMFHKSTEVSIKFKIDNKVEEDVLLKWENDFQTGGYRERRDIAEHGSIGIGFFLMSILQGYHYVIQTEQSSGVDYQFKKTTPNEEEENFLNPDCGNETHYVEISGLLEESKTNTIARRLKYKHNQINKGSMCSADSSVIITLFKTPLTIKETHKQ